MTSGPWIGSRQKKIGYILVSECSTSTFDVAYPIQADNVIVSFSCIKFNSETSRVAS